MPPGAPAAAVVVVGGGVGGAGVLVALVGALGPVDADALDYGYFTITPDLRLCPSPICGGFYLQALNQPSTTCGPETPRPTNWFVLET